MRVVLDEVRTEPADHVHVHWEVAVALLVVVEGLRLVLLLKVDVPDARLVRVRVGARDRAILGESRCVPGLGVGWG